MTDAFFVPDGDAFESTRWTMGPWDPNAQHAGPPSALLGRAFDLLPSDMPMQVARFTVEIFKPIPIARLRVDARVVRPGKRVQYAQAALLDGDDAVARASAWRIRVSDADEVASIENSARDVPGPEGIEPWKPFEPVEPKYICGMEWRFARSDFESMGPAAAWMRLRIPLVAGEETMPLSRVLAAADSGNGISHEIEFGQALFINTELTVHLFRAPATEWVCLDARTHQNARGIGLAESNLWDERGLIGRGAQALYLGAR
jgi:hypothetical protein